MRTRFGILLLSLAAFACDGGPGGSLRAEDLSGLVFLSLGECPSGPNWEPVIGYEGRLLAVDDAVSGEPSTQDADPDDLVISLRGPCQGKGRIGVADAPDSTAPATGGILCNAAKRKGAHVHDQVGFRLCRITAGAAGGGGAG